MKEKENIQEELQQCAPFLAQLRKTAKTAGQQQVPEGYFETLPDRVLEAAQAEKASLLKVVHTAERSRQPGWHRWAAAVAVALISAAGLWYNWQSTPGTAQVSLADVEREEAAAYINANISEFELSLMEEADLLDETTVENVEVLPELDQIPIEDYLENLDYKDIEALF
ncbi:MAG: hypothetical protein RIC19_23580 [Phaeodactylibacter sp.]|uniref:hypothetical protein n=1 Tax=Phaeodactylibacter sp. TaxID=1940289 RepID=UPI0032ED974B